MARSTLASEVRSRIESAASELAGMIRAEAMAAVAAALGGDGAAPTRRRGPGRPRGKRRGPGRPKAKRAARRPGRPPSAAPEALAPKVLAQVKSKDGQGVIEIAKALRVDVERVKPVMVKLLAAKQVRKTGERRGTRYHAAGSGGAATPKRAARKAERKATRKRVARKATRKRAARTATKRKAKATRKRAARKAPRREATRKRPTRKAPRRKATRKGARRKVSARKPRGPVRKAPVAPKSTTQELAEAVAKGA